MRRFKRKRSHSEAALKTAEIKSLKGKLIYVD
jgi:hypothetical protein